VERLVDLTTALTPRPAGEPGRFTAEIPDGWQQGRGAYGGLALGLLASAMAIPGRPLRSLTGALPAPTPVGTAEIAVAVLRAGTGVTTVEARLVAGGGVTAHAVGIFGRSRGDTAGWCDLSPPDVPPADEVPAWEDMAFAPRFTQHWRYRVIGPMPFASGKPEVRGWLEARAPGTGRDAAFLVAAADVWWPAAYSAFAAPRPMATVQFTLQILVDPASVDPAAPLLHVGRTEVLADGYTAERRELWTPDGRLACINQQTFAVL
jgi:hypothetical protein